MSSKKPRRSHLRVQKSSSSVSEVKHKLWKKKKKPSIQRSKLVYAGDYAMRVGEIQEELSAIQSEIAQQNKAGLKPDASLAARKDELLIEFRELEQESIDHVREPLILDAKIKESQSFEDIADTAKQSNSARIKEIVEKKKTKEELEKKNTKTNSKTGEKTLESALFNSGLEKEGSGSDIKIKNGNETFANIHFSKASGIPKSKYKFNGGSISEKSFENSAASKTIRIKTSGMDNESASVKKEVLTEALVGAGLKVNADNSEIVKSLVNQIYKKGDFENHFDKNHYVGLRIVFDNQSNKLKIKVGTADNLDQVDGVSNNATEIDLTG